MRVRALLVAAFAVCAAGSHATAPAAARGSSPGRELLSYLAAVDQARSSEDGIRAQSAFTATLERLSDRPDRSWTVAAERAGTYARVARRVARGFAALRAPAGLRGAHAGLVGSARLRAQVAGAVRAALLRRNPARLLRLFSRIDVTLGPRIAALDGRWRRAVVSAAHAAGVNVPAWVSSFGSRGP
jgi:hypothetical protein